MADSGHYALAHSPVRLAVWAKKIAMPLTEHLGGAYPIFCYRGMSGVATATALSIAYAMRDGPCPPFGMIYVRKENEHSHGQRVEYKIPSLMAGEKYRFVFVDDFVSSGTTRDITLDAAITAKRKYSDFDYVFDTLDQIDRDFYVVATTGDCYDAREFLGTAEYSKHQKKLWAKVFGEPEPVVSVKDFYKDDLDWDLGEPQKVAINPPEGNLQILNIDWDKVPVNSTFGKLGEPAKNLCNEIRLADEYPLDTMARKSERADWSWLRIGNMPI